MAAAGDANEAWAALVKGGHVALIRHGNAPPGYGGDPPGFKIDDCKTQRNLDEQGRGEARALGEAFRSHGVRVDRILSSPWCRCLETARLMAVGSVETSWALVPDMQPSVSVRRGELKDARKALDAALKLKPDYALAHATLAYLHMVSGNARDAEAEATKAIALAPELPDAHYVLGLLRLRQEAWLKALEEAEAVIKLDPTSPGAYSLKTQALLGLQRPEERSVVPPGGAGGHLGPFQERDLGAPPGELEGGRAPDDPSAHHDDIGILNVRRTHFPASSPRSSPGTPYRTADEFRCCASRPGKGVQLMRSRS